MDKSIPVSAAHILKFIRNTEVGRDDLSSYDVIYGHNQGRLGKRITTMTLLEVQAGQSKQWANHDPHGRKITRSSATGAYQFMYKTLGGLIEEFDLDIDAPFTPVLQDWLAYQLLIRRGYFKWIKGGSRTTFGNSLAREWASFPVLSNVKGQKRPVKRGQSFYAGDGVNKALVSPKAVEAVLDDASRLPHRTPVTPPPPDIPACEPGRDPGPVLPPTQPSERPPMITPMVKILGLVGIGFAAGSMFTAGTDFGLELGKSLLLLAGGAMAWIGAKIKETVK